ncbi:hypothetical protein [Quadrisphaera granulorum]|uniref:hypothetical protein n=1 Tax=Quadrisphaera granulorum TaxID=317664 RepID=UPI0011B39800|nr:hypothetical protein [Quadrisphaera granulorum]
MIGGAEEAANTTGSSAHDCPAENATAADEAREAGSEADPDASAVPAAQAPARCDDPTRPDRAPHTRAQARRCRAAASLLPPRGPARRVHAATRKDVARRGLPGPEGMDPSLIDFAVTARAVPEAEWCWGPTVGDWRVVTAADEVGEDFPQQIPHEVPSDD